MTDRPNVLLICTDHWSGDLLGCAGHSAIRTPTLDALARCGTRFRRAYSESPVCVPARRTLMTGTTPRTHGDRTFQQDKPMPDLPTLADTFRAHGYQAYAVGKLHVYPQRSRIGFDDVILSEEGRNQWGLTDDYDAYLAQSGHAGQRFAHGMSNNHYVWRPWHLPEEAHETNWATREMVRTIRRRDPTRPGFWYLSYSAPHPPLTPLKEYLDMYREEDMDMPVMGEWADEGHLPHQLQRRQQADGPAGFSEQDVRLARRAFYAQCTHIDHQIRLVIGALRGEGLLDNTVILFTSDHGDMLGDHDLWAKRVFYEKSANVPMLLLGTADSDRVGAGQTDDRLVGLQDIMPTLLDLAGIPAPAAVEGRSMVDSSTARRWLYGEYGEGGEATRMVHDGRYKLIYYPVGHHIQLFDVELDPRECRDLADREEFAALRSQLLSRLIQELHGSDEAWLADGRLVGLPEQPVATRPDRGLSQQRSLY